MGLQREASFHIDYIWYYVWSFTAEDSSNPDQTQKSDVASKELLRLMDVNRDLEGQLEILQTQLITSKEELSHRREKVLGGVILIYNSDVLVTTR